MLKIDHSVEFVKIVFHLFKKEYLFFNKNEITIKNLVYPFSI